MRNEKSRALYEVIVKAVVNGELPEDFCLPKYSLKPRTNWVDGSLDSINCFYTEFPKITEEGRALMRKAIYAASERKFEEAERLFSTLGQMTRAISFIEELPRYVIEHREDLLSEHVLEYTVYVIISSHDQECVKFGLIMQEAFTITQSEIWKEVLRKLGLCDEFSLFVILHMRFWENANQEIYQLAKKTHGWGRIHAIERIRPETEEIREWLLKEGVHNRIFPSYSALNCWQKSGAEKVLRNNPTREELSGIRDIIEGLLEEDFNLGISKIENKEEVLSLFLTQIKKVEAEPADEKVIRKIKEYRENNKNK